MNKLIVCQENNVYKRWGKPERIFLSDIRIIHNIWCKEIPSRQKKVLSNYGKMENGVRQKPINISDLFKNYREVIPFFFSVSCVLMALAISPFFSSLYVEVNIIILLSFLIYVLPSNYPGWLDRLWNASLCTSWNLQYLWLSKILNTFCSWCSLEI